MELKGPGGACVHGYFDLRDQAGSGVTKGMRFRQTSNDHTAFTTGYCQAIGNTIGIIVADTQELANQAAAAASAAIVYEEECDQLPAPLAGAIYSIDEAIEKDKKLKVYRKELKAACDAMTSDELVKESEKWGLTNNQSSLSDDELRQKLKMLYNDMFCACEAA